MSQFCKNRIFTFMKNLFSLLFLLSCLIISCGDDKEEDETSETGTSNLQYKFKQGQEFYVTLDWSEIVEKRDSTGKGTTDTSNMTSTFKYVVDRVDENG